jgi:hypothetical protein
MNYQSRIFDPYPVAASTRLLKFLLESYKGGYDMRIIKEVLKAPKKGV